MIVRHRIWTVAVCFFTSILLFACSTADQDPESPIDKNAVPYRMFFDNSSDVGENELQIRHFSGQLWLNDVAGIFGEIGALPTDEDGNHRGGPILEGGLIWNLVATPNGSGLNLVTEDISDGTLSSALDLDGDRVADIVDIRLGDGRRISFVTEDLGMGVFEAWLSGENPLCRHEFLEELGLEEFGCGENEGGSAEGDGSPGGDVTTVPGTDYVDPLDMLCADYKAGRFDPAVSTRSVSLLGYTDVQSARNGSYVITDTAITRSGETGEMVRITRVIRYFDDRGVLTRRTNEYVDSDGSGYRVINDYDDEHHVTGRVEAFEANLDDQGNYKSYQTSPPAENPNTDDPDEPQDTGDSPSEPPSGGPDSGRPGPDGDDTTLAEICKRRATYVSGVEQAAATDPTTFQVGCGELVGAPAGGEDCSIIQWARPDDFRDVLQPSGDDDGCQEFYQRGQGGDCEPTTALEILRGRTALVASANFDIVNICPPIVCNDNPVANIERQKISSTGIPPGGIATVTQTTLAPPYGEIPGMSLCYFGPGLEYGTVSSLPQGSRLEILGIGGEGGWIVVDNPRYPGVACWVAENEILIPDLILLAELPIFQAPPIPAPLATKTRVPSAATPTCGPNIPNCP